MKQAIIDIGSNSIRLTVYKTDGSSFKILFRDKFTAGLAEYVENGTLSQEGIERACTCLLDFKETLELLDIENVAVFATASLRNIANTNEAVAAIKAATDYPVEVISGAEEALLGYTGAMKELNLNSGAFIDIGGASTEIVVFDNGLAGQTVSFPIGSLNLYKNCVKKILPGEGSLKRIEDTIIRAVDGNALFSCAPQDTLVCVGGTARAMLKVARKKFGLPKSCHSITAAQLDDICDLFCKNSKETAGLILKLEPDRIHTLVPGAMILQHICKLLEANELIISKFGVREGYLCQKVLRESQNDISIPKTEN